MDIRQLDIADSDIVQTGSGPDLLLLHTLLAERSVFDRVLPELAARFRLTIPNLPGYGATPPLNLEAPLVADYASYVAGLMDAGGLPRDTAVLGNGAGGFISVALAVRHGDRIGRLILADTGAGFPDAAKPALHALADRVESEGMQAVLDASMKRMFPQPWIEAHPQIIAERRQALAACNPKAFAATARALAHVDMHDAIAGIENPTLVIVGLDDATTPPVMSRELHDGIHGSRLVEIADCGHCPQIQAPKAFLEAVIDFLEA